MHCHCQQLGVQGTLAIPVVAVVLHEALKEFSALCSLVEGIPQAVVVHQVVSEELKFARSCLLLLSLQLELVSVAVPQHLPIFLCE